MKPQDMPPFAPDFDLRNAIAKARDDFLDSAEGIRLTKGTAQGQYLRNRIEAAFVAGWNAKEQSRGR